MTSLTSLIERIEAATEGSRELDILVGAAIDLRVDECQLSFRHSFEICGMEQMLRSAESHQNIWREALPRYSTSIDAALTLMPKRWWLTLDRYCISDKSVDPFAWRVWLKRTVGDDDGDGPCGMQKVFAVGPTPPLALLAAILKARQAAAQPAKQAEAR